ncbi:MAG: hypothetical protein ACI9MB_003801 [Verrucomicrobiales bacterium]
METPSEKDKKLLFDGFKHLTTINAALVVLLPTIFEKAGKKSAIFTNSAFWMLLAFVVSTVASMLAMFILAYSVTNDGDVGRKLEEQFWTTWIRKVPRSAKAALSEIDDPEMHFHTRIHLVGLPIYGSSNNTPLSPHLRSLQRSPQAPHAKSKFLGA